MGERWLRAGYDGQHDLVAAFTCVPAFLLRLSEKYATRRLRLHVTQPILAIPSLELSERFVLSLSFTQQSAPVRTAGVFWNLGGRLASG